MWPLGCRNPQEWPYVWWLSTEDSNLFRVGVIVVQLLSPVGLFETSWTVAHQASLSAMSQSLLKYLLNKWRHPAISSSVAPFSYPQSFPASQSFPVTQFFASDGQSIGASAPASVLPMNIQGWFPLGLTGLISLPSKGLFGKLMQALHLFSRKLIRHHETWDMNAKPRALAFAEKS